MSSIFNEPTDQVVVPPSQQQDPVVQSPSFEFIGEGKKYKTPEDALKSIPHKDEHIARIEAENAEMRAKLAEAKSVDSILERLSQGEGEQQPAQVNSVTSVSKEDINSLIQETITQREFEQTAKQNVSTVIEKFKSLYGDKAQETFEDKAKQLGVPVEWLNETAARSPTAVFEIFGLNTKRETTPSKPEGTIRTDFTAPVNNTERKPIMFGAKQEDVINAWRRVAPPQN